MRAERVITMYEELGGEPAVRALVMRFYDIMDSDAAMAPLRALHAADLGTIREKLGDWMCAWLGGPQRYFARPDAVCFVAAHRRFAIDAALRDLWLACMHRAFDDIGTAAATQARILPPLTELANFVRNR